MDFTTFLLVIMLLTALITAIFALVWYAPSILAIPFKGAPYVPSNRKVVKSMIELANLEKHHRTMDFGSGDGRIPMAAVEAGASHAIGVDLNPGLIWQSKIVARRKGLHEKTDFRIGNMWRADLSNIDVLFMYQLYGRMEAIGEKCLSEMKPGARVISHGFSIPNLSLVHEEESPKIFVYEIKKEA